MGFVKQKGTKAVKTLPSDFESINCEFVNKRPMGHIAHLRKQFKSINTYDNIITLIKRRKKTHYYLYEN